MAKKLNYASLFTLRKDGRYMASYTDASGRHFLYDRDPEQLHARLQAVKSAEPAPVTFKDVAEAWEKGYRETVSVRSWNNLKPHYDDIKATHGDSSIKDITASDINTDFLKAKAKGYSHTVVNNRRVVYNGILNYAVANGYIPFNPAMSVKLPKGLKQGKRSAPEDEQIKIICENVKKAPFGFFPFLLLCTGMRKSEALALLTSDINIKNKTISVTKSLAYNDGSTPTVKEPKTKAGVREVPIIDALLPYLQEICKDKDRVYLFPASRSNRNPKAQGYMSAHAYDGAWERYCSAVGLTGITAHHLRHATATLLYETGIDVYTAQHILGHANISTTMSIYTELRNKQKAKSVKKFNKKLSKMLSESL